MRPIGYSTGSLGKADFIWALDLLQRVGVRCVELSALRLHELPAIMNSLDALNLSEYDYVSFHAPSRFKIEDEQSVVSLLEQIKERGWPIIVHPDVVKQPDLWRRLGNAVCIENMDKRKPTGRNVTELRAVFNALPEAGFCFDIAHALQIDPTMSQASLMLSLFRERLRQVHVSAVDAQSVHHPLHMGAMIAYQRIYQLIPENIPLILESPLLDRECDPVEEVRSEMMRARDALPGLYSDRKFKEELVPVG